MAYATVAALRQWLQHIPDTAEQTVTLAGATGGTVALDYDGDVATVAWNATASTVRSALAALPSIAAYAVPLTNESVVQVRGRRGGPWAIRFLEPLGNDAELLVADAASLTGTTPTATVTPTQDALLQSCLDEATALIDEHLAPLRFSGFSAPEARLVAGYGGTTLYLPPHQPGSVTLVQLGSQTIEDWTPLPSDPTRPIEHLYREDGWVTTAPERSAFDSLERGAYGWSLDRDDYLFRDTLVSGGYRITARWGYGDAPASIAELCKEIAVNIWRSKDRGLFTEVQGAEGGGALRYIGGLNKTQLGILAAVKTRLLEQAI